MKVVVWKGHGVIDVYAVDSIEQIKLFKNDVVEVAKHYPGKAVLNLVENIHSLQGIINWVDRHCNGDDSFERLEICSVKHTGFA